MVLLSIDSSYYGDSDEYVGDANRILADNKVQWPGVFLPDGWADAQRMFNASGYGKIVVDAQGIVRAANVHAHELEGLIRKVIADTKTTSGDAVD